MIRKLKFPHHVKALLLVVLISAPCAFADESLTVRWLPTFPFAYGNLDVLFKAGDSWSLGPSAFGTNGCKVTRKAEGSTCTERLLGYGLRVNYHITGKAFDSGLYISPSIYHVRKRIDKNLQGSVQSGTFDSFAPALWLGYVHRFQSTGWSVSIGGGGYYLVDQPDKLKLTAPPLPDSEVDPGNRLQFFPDVNVGYTF